MVSAFSSTPSSICYKTITIDKTNYLIADLSSYSQLNRLPYSYRILLENILRQKINQRNQLADEQLDHILEQKVGSSISFKPNRILSHDILGKVMLVDFLAYREALVQKNLSFENVQPKIPIDLVIDHSLQVDYYGNRDAAKDNLKKEYSRNSERFSFLRWCSKNLKNVRVIPPGVGICHQVNIEYLSQVVWQDRENDQAVSVLHPDTCVGTDSHTPMVNAIGVLGWGVGGIEAEIAMLGKSIPMALPEVVGIELKEELPPGITSTDLVLHITQLLRRKKVVNNFIEFFGTGVDSLTVGDRATISNMAPEYGATAVLFPVDKMTLAYLEMTGRSKKQIALVEQYSQIQGLWRNNQIIPTYSRVIELDLAKIKPCVAGPKNPEDKINLENFSQEINQHSRKLYQKDLRLRTFSVKKFDYSLQDGDIFIAAITSCTNTTNPKNMIGAGLVAKRLVELGFTKNKKVKTSLAPGSQVTAEILQKSDLQPYLDQLGFNLVGYGCTTCNGGSGPLHPNLVKSIESNQIFSVAILSGNRNFQGRIHPNIRAVYLCSPPLVILFSILGNVNKSLFTDSLGQDQEGKDVFFQDVWPSDSAIDKIIQKHYQPRYFVEKYSQVLVGGALWEGLSIPESSNYQWSDKSTYFKRPPYLEAIKENLIVPVRIQQARPLVLLGDSITTDHISPSSAITLGTAAGDYLTSRGVASENFNNYTTRRAHHEVVMRATFANLRLRNQIIPEQEGSYTRKYPEGQKMRIFEAAREYQRENVPLLIIAGENYGCGSSRDSAAKGLLLLGVKAVLAKSFERIHRSNLIGMGILPLQFKTGEGISELGIRGEDVFTVFGLDKISFNHQEVDLIITQADRKTQRTQLLAKLDTPEEINFWQNGGILPAVWRETVRRYNSKL